MHRANHLRKLLVTAAAKRFDRLPVPDSFNAASGDPVNQTIVLRGSSVVIEGLLYSFARRSGFSAIKHSSNTEGECDDRYEDKVLFYAGVEEEDLLRKISAASPSHKFSTMNVIYGRGPLRSMRGYRVSLLQALGAFLLARRLIVVFGSPITLATSGSPGEKSFSRRLKVDFYRHLKLVRGAPFHSRHQQRRIILGGADYERECVKLAGMLGISPAKVKRRASKAFDDLAANPIRSIFLVIALIAKFVVYSVFSKVRIEGLESFRKAAKEHPVVVVPAHRSHLDYIVLSWLLHKSGLNSPLIAAGQNLCFRPVGFFLRSSGAFFVKRNAGDPVHGMVLKRYVTYLIKRGHLQEFFIEGGRSRSGRMRAPRTGLLKIQVDAYLKGIRKDICYVPVSITYDTVVEEAVFGSENTGAVKEKENLIALLKARKIFRRKYGEVIVTLGDPLPLSRFISGHRKSSTEVRKVVHELAYELTDKIRSYTSPTLSGLAYTSLLMAPRYTLTEDELSRAIFNLISLVELRRAQRPETGAPADSLKRFLSGDSRLLGELARSGVITKSSYLSSTAHTVSGNKRFTADFYKNGVLHLFLPAGLFSLTELMHGEVSVERAMEFHKLFENDLLLPPPDLFKRDLQSSLSLMLERGFLKDSGGKITFSERVRGIFIPELLLPAVQSRIWAYRVIFSPSPGLIEQSKTSDKPQTLGYDALMGYLQSHFKTAVNLGVVTRTEAGSYSALAAALESLRSIGVINISTNESGRKLVEIRAEDPVLFKLLITASDSIRGWMCYDLKALSKVD